MTARRSFAAIVAGLLAGLVLAVMPAASPAYADAVTDQAAKEVATARCEKLLDTVIALPNQWSEVCASKLANDLLTGAADAASWVKDTCKKWVPDLPLIGSPCDRLAGVLNGVYDEYAKRVQDLRDAAGALLNPVEKAMNDLSETIANGLKSLMTKVFTEMVHLSSPNLQSKSFLSTYAAGAGIGMFVLVFMVARVFYKASTGDLSGEELAESVWRWVPTAMLLVLFGPALGYLVVQLTDAASVSIIEYFAGDVASLATKLQKMAVLSNTGVVPGGPLVGIVIMLFSMAGVIGLLGGLLVQLLALYLTGSVMAISFVMTVDPETRPKALKVPVTWVGLTLAKPALFFLVGALARFADSAFSVQAIKDDGMRSLVTALVAALALLIVGVAPWSLLKFGPALPAGSGDRFAKASRGSSTGALGNMASSTMMHLSYRRMQGSPGGGGGGGGDSSPPPSESSGQPTAAGDGQASSGADQRKVPQTAGGESSPGGTDGASDSASPAGGSTATTSGAGAPAPASPGAAASGSGAGGGGAAGGIPAGAASGGGAAGGGAAGGAAGATAATGGLAAAALIGVQAADAAKRKADDVAHRASDSVGE